MTMRKQINPWEIKVRTLTEEKKLECRRAGWDQQVALDTPRNTQAYYDLVAQLGGKVHSVSDFEPGTFEHGFQEFLANDPRGPAVAGCPWRSYDMVGREIAEAVGEGVLLRRAEEPRP